MRVYETMIIFDAEVQDDGVRAFVDQRISKLIEDSGGSIRDVDYWGLRELKYEIDHKSNGYYIVLLADAEPATMDELGRVLSLADEVIRHKTLRLPDHVAESLGSNAQEATA